MIRIRGHTILCLQGFRGEGYSPAFVDNMWDIHRQLFRDVTTPVTVLEEPDSICRACPHKSDEGCHLNGPDSEANMMRQDQDVLRRLGLEARQTYSWNEILQRIHRNVAPADLDVICKGCRWLPLGYCKAGIHQLNDSEGIV